MPPDPRFIAIIDAGSTSSRLLLYNYDRDIIAKHRYTKPLDLKKVCESETKDPISGVDANLRAMKTYLTPLLDACAGEVTPYRRMSVPLYVMATAGMRDDNGDIPPPSTATMRRAWEAIRVLRQGRDLVDPRKVYDIGVKIDAHGGFNAVIDRYSFVVPAKDEGVYAWAALSHGLDRFDLWMPGILELGGKSLQVAYQTHEEEDFKEVCLWNSKYKVRSHSWVLGAEVSRNRVESWLPDTMDNPCLPYPQRSRLGGTGRMATGDGEFPICLTVAGTYLDSIDAAPSLNMDHLANRFYSLSNFWYTYEFFSQFGVYSKDRPYDPKLFAQAARKYCNGKSWFPYDYFGSQKHIHKHCFAAAWMRILFHHQKGFNLPLAFPEKMKELIHFPMTKELQDRSSWTIGAAVMVARHDNANLFCSANEVYPNRTQSAILSGPSSPTPVVTPPFVDESAHPARAPSIPTSVACSPLSSIPFNQSNPSSTFYVALVSGVLLIALVLIGYRRFSTRRVVQLPVQLPVSDEKKAIGVDEAVHTHLAFFDKARGAVFLAGADNISYV